VKIQLDKPHLHYNNYFKPLNNNKNYYRGKIIVGGSDRRDGIIIFATSDGGYTEEQYKGAEELLNVVKKVLAEGKYEVQDVQNGPTKQDAEHCSHYLSCFPPTDHCAFEYLKYRLEQK